LSLAYITHWSLDTGQHRRFACSKVSHEASAEMSERLAFALAGGQPQIAFEARASMTAAVVEGMGLVVTVWVCSDAVVTFGVAGDRTLGPRLWRRMHEERLLASGVGPPVTNRDKPATVPWILERRESGILSHTFPRQELIDFEGCAAWVWLARQYELAKIKGAS
jgi:hypothetical protein